MIENIGIDDPKTLLGKTIRALRERRGLSQTALADTIGKPSQTVNKWERGVRWPEYGNFEEIAKALGVPVMALFDWDVPPPAPPSIAALAAEVDRQAAEIARLMRELNAAQIPALTGQKRELFDLVAGLDDTKAEGLLRLIRRTLEISSGSNDFNQPQVLRKKPRR